MEEIQVKSQSHKNWTIWFGIPDYPIFPKEIESD
jgi:hypothetical protein